MEDSSESAGGSLFETVVERVTVVKFRVDIRGSNGTGCFRIKVRTCKTQYSIQVFYTDDFN